MSRATGAVRFDDGTVRWCLYNGTSDVLVPRLFDHPEDAWAAYYPKDGDEHIDLFPMPVGEAEHVVIYSDYGGGFYWDGTATRTVVIEPLEPLDVEPENYHDGTPDWYSPAYQAARRG